jgi:DNA-binding NarL/FixJ family response regulator
VSLYDFRPIDPILPVMHAVSQGETPLNCGEAMRLAATNCKIRVMLVEAHVLVRMGLISAINLEPDLEVVMEAEDGGEVVKRFRECSVDVVVLNLAMRSTDGVDVIRKLRSELGSIRILALSLNGGCDDVARAEQEGARGCIVKGMGLDHLLEGIRAVHAGGNYFPHQIAGRIAQAMRPEVSRREDAQR